jgi:hypothetical protein
MYPHSFKEELSSFLSCDALLTGGQNRHHGKVINNHKNKVISSHGAWWMESPTGSPLRWISRAYQE